MITRTRRSRTQLIDFLCLVFGVRLDRKGPWTSLGAIADAADVDFELTKIIDAAGLYRPNQLGRHLVYTIDDLRMTAIVDRCFALGATTTDLITFGSRAGPNCQGCAHTNCQTRCDNVEWLRELLVRLKREADSGPRASPSRQRKLAHAISSIDTLDDLL